MISKIRISILPVTEEPIPRRRLVQERGELALLEDGACFRHLGYWSLHPDTEFFRGGHYHQNKTEEFYLVAGRLRANVVDLDTSERAEFLLEAGQRMTIEPRCAHRFQAEQEAQVIEYYDGVYDREDDHPFDGF